MTVRASKIYKICAQSEWNAAEGVGVYTGSAVDVEDGFIHFSTADQVGETAAKYFKNQENLVLVEVDLECHPLAIKWEPSRGGDLFPHLYEALAVNCVTRVWSLALDGEGVPIIPEGVGG